MYSIIDDITTTDEERAQIMAIPDEACKNLANAIIIRACLDYNIGFNKQGVKNFFKSDWFTILSRGAVPVDTLINHLEKEGVKCGEKFFASAKF